MPEFISPLIAALVCAAVPYFLKQQEERAKEIQKKKDAEMAELEARIKDLEKQSHQCDKDRATMGRDYDNLSKKVDGLDEKLDHVIRLLTSGKSQP